MDHPLSVNTSPALRGSSYPSQQYCSLLFASTQSFFNSNYPPNGCLHFMSPKMPSALFQMFYLFFLPSVCPQVQGLVGGFLFMFLINQMLIHWL